ncbi:hypothetical protein ACFPU1_15120 [Thalassorhabdus alkalitolerans]|uniref:Hook-length control protein FliK n=1 Tax=Thalassorhabdus alkalitolerans TaxID=2282697 RepID=A0ABW0YRR2_9BACI
MDVGHISGAHVSTQREAAHSVQKGEVHRAVVTERLSHNEAVVHMKGQEVRVQFEVTLPKHDRVTVEVAGRADEGQGKILVKALPDETGRQSQRDTGTRADEVLKRLGAGQPVSKEVRQSAQLLLDKGVPLTKETVKALRQFFDEGAGSSLKRIQTVKALAGKHLEVTRPQLQAVHEALHGRPLQETLQQISAKSKRINEMGQRLTVQEEQAVTRALQRWISQQNQQTTAQTSLNETLQEVRNRTAQLSNVQETIGIVRNQLLTHPEISETSAKQLEKVLKQADYLQQTGRERLLQAFSQTEEGESGSTGQFTELLKKGTDLTSMRNEAVSILPPGNKRQALAVERGINQAIQLENAGSQRIGQVLQSMVSAGPIEEVLQQAHKQLGKEPDFRKAADYIRHEAGNHPELSDKQQTQLTDGVQRAINKADNGMEMAARQEVAALLLQMKEQVLEHRTNDTTGLLGQNQSRLLLETKITEKLAALTGEFQGIKRDVTKKLDQAHHLMEERRTAPQARQLLETTIKSLDKTILRSEMTLFTDMKTERSLLQASSQLAEASKFLQKNMLSEARQIVRQVQSLIERLQFHPSEQKLKHFTASGKEQGERLTSTQRQASPADAYRPSSLQEGSARQVFDYLRSIGFNREAEISQSLAGNRSPIGDENVKHKLMQLARNEEEGSRLQQQAAQGVNHITGQQLLSKPDPGSPIQTMFFSLPYLLKGKVKNLQVYVNSRDERGTLDWENCSLYFLIETKKLGEVGISVQASERNLQVTLKNDQQNLKSSMEPLIKKTENALTELGYRVAGIHFKAFTEKETKEEDQSDSMPVFTEKGFDYKI